MAATSLTSHGLGHGHGKISKSRARSSVKPILKKLHSTHSEKNSLDLDRGWDDQESPHLGYVAPDDSSYGAYAFGPSGKQHNHQSYHNHSQSWDYTGDESDGLFGTSYPVIYPSAGTGAAGLAGAAAGTADGTANTANIPSNGTARPARDVSFTLAATDLSTSMSNASRPMSRSGTASLAPTTSAATATTCTSTTSTTLNSITTSNTVNTAATSSANTFTHARSTSGVSNISTATSTSANARNGSFVHPFQQTPRTSTPPLLSYANSVNSQDNTAQRDYSPTITENDDDSIDPFGLPTPGSRTLQSTLPHSHSNWGYRRPSMPASQRTNSLSEQAPSSVRVSTARTNLVTAVPRGASFATPASVNQYRLSDGQLAGTPSVTVVDDSPIGSASLANSHSPHLAPSQTQGSSMSPMSPLRHSLDMNNFRIRSRSDVDTATRQEQVRQARRKFEEKEKAKEEKYAREQTRKRERADKDAHRHSRKGSFGAVGRISLTDVRPEMTRKSTSHSRNTPDKSSTPTMASSPSGAFSSQLYDDMTTGKSPRGRADEVHFEPNKRKSTRTTTKRKTTGAWTGFVLWFRTRMLKLGRR